MVVYVDIVIITNMTINFLILFGVSKVTYTFAKYFRLVLASLAGGIYAVFMFDKELAFLYSAAVKLLVSLLIVYIAFGFKSGKKFVKLMVYYYVISFMFAGAAAFFNNYLGVIKMKNGVIYLDNNIWILIGASIISLLLVTVVLKLIVRLYKREPLKRGVRITIEGKSTELFGIIDTGNSLLDPITLYPVIIAEYDLIKPILPAEIKEFLKEGSSLKCSLNRRYLNKIRLIPSTGVSGHSILKGFKPDKLEIVNTEKTVIKDVFVAVTYHRLSENNEFNAILNPQLI